MGTMPAARTVLLANVVLLSVCLDIVVAQAVFLTTQSHVGMLDIYRMLYLRQLILYLKLELVTVSVQSSEAVCSEWLVTSHVVQCKKMQSSLKY